MVSYACAVVSATHSLAEGDGFCCCSKWLARVFPKEEMYGLTSQLRRAAVSIPSNIPEGQGQQTTGEFRQFLGHARGSLLETETQILLAGRFECLDGKTGEAFIGQTAELGRILNGLMKSLEESRR